MHNTLNALSLTDLHYIYLQVIHKVFSILHAFSYLILISYEEHPVNSTPILQMKKSRYKKTTTKPFNQ